MDTTESKSMKLWEKRVDEVRTILVSARGTDMYATHVHAEFLNSYFNSEKNEVDNSIIHLLIRKVFEAIIVDPTAFYKLCDEHKDSELLQELKAYVEKCRKEPNV
jgi:hypothetical protein